MNFEFIKTENLLSGKYTYSFVSRVFIYRVWKAKENTKIDLKYNMGYNLRQFILNKFKGEKIKEECIFSTLWASLSSQRVLTKLLSCKQKKAVPCEFSHTFSNGIKLHFQRSLFTVDDTQLPCYITAVPVFLTSKTRTWNISITLLKNFFKLRR